MLGNTGRLRPRVVIIMKEANGRTDESTGRYPTLVESSIWCECLSSDSAPQICLSIVGALSSMVDTVFSRASVFSIASSSFSREICSGGGLERGLLGSVSTSQHGVGGRLVGGDK